MITLLVLLGLAFLGVIVLGTVGVGFLIAFGDVIVAVLIVYCVYKLFNHGKKESKK